MDLAMKFLAEIFKPELQANPPLHITYRPTNKKAYKIGKIDDALARAMPSYPDNAKLQVTVNQKWYEGFEKLASTLYQEMITE